MEFAIFLKNERNKLGISTRELSKRLGKSTGYIADLESGKTKLPSRDVAYKLFEEFNVEDPVKLMAHFGIIENIEKTRELFRWRMSKQDEILRTELIKIIEEADFELLTSIFSLLKKDKKVLNDLAFLYENNKKSYSSIKDYLEFLIVKNEK